MSGLTNVPVVFQHLRNRVLEPFRRRVAMFCLEDVLIPAENWEDLIQRLLKLLEALRKANLTPRLSKRSFAMDTVNFLSFCIADGSLKPGKQKLQGTAKFPASRNTHDIRRLLGFTRFFRRLIPKYALVAQSLSIDSRRKLESERLQYFSCKHSMCQAVVRGLRISGLI